MSEQNQPIEEQASIPTAELPDAPVEQPAGEGPEGEGNTSANEAPNQVSLKDALAGALDAESEEEDGAGFSQFLQMMGLVQPDPTNLRKAEPFVDVEFRAYPFTTEVYTIETTGEAEPAAGFESFQGTEFEAKLNDAVERKLNLIFFYRCPANARGGDCDKQWHQYAVTLHGEEYVHWFLATKMATGSGIWIDDRKVSDDGRIGNSSEVRSGDSGGEPAAEGAEAQTV